MNKDDNASSFLPTQSSPLVHWTFVWLGISLLFPWNVYLKAISYFSLKLDHSRWAQTFPSYLTTVYTVTMVVGTLILVLWRPDERFWSSSKALSCSSCYKIIAGLSINLVLLTASMGLPLFDLLSGSSSEAPSPTNPSASTFFTLILVIFATLGAITALLQKASFTIVAKFPPSYTPSILGGQAVAGVTVSLINLIINWVTFTIGKKQIQPNQDNVRTLITIGAIIYFGCALMVVSISLAFFIYMRKNSKLYRQIMQLDISPAQDFSPAIDQDTSFPSSLLSISAIRQCMIRIWPLGLGVFGVLFVTISVVSSFITAGYAPTRQAIPELYRHLFMPIVFLIYDLGDLMGRWMPSVPVFTSHPTSIWLSLLPWLRLVIFVPLFTFAPVRYSSAPEPPLVEGSEFLYFILIYLFGLSNGFVCTLDMMHAPGRFAAIKPTKSTNKDASTALSDHSNLNLEVHQARELVGPLMSLCLNLGLAAGATSSFLMRGLICRCNPFRA